MSETIGNWVVDVQTTDTITSPKTISIPDLDYSHDYNVATSKPTEVRLFNATGASLRPAEKLAYSTRRIANVYASGLSADLDVCGAQRANCAEGVHLTAELAYMLKATNTVSGDEVVLPMRGSITLVVPTADIISPNAVTILEKRLIATLFGTGETDSSQVVAMLRGDLDPTA